MNKDILKLLKDRYFLNNENTWEELAERIGKLYEPISEHIKNMEFVPSSPTLMNANTNGERKGTLSSCFPMNIEDSIDNIMDSMKECAEVTRMGGGVGYDFSVLRGSSETVKSNGKKSGGILSFISIYDAVLSGIKQGGARRGAGASMCSIYHPQIIDFIDAKKNLDLYNRSNFSIKIDSQFYKILEKEPNKIFQTTNITDKKKNDLKDSSGTICTYQMLWDKIVESAWSMAEPGILNEELIRERSTLIHIDNKALINPCAEFVTTVPYTSCNLGSIDVSKFIKDRAIDYVSLNTLVRKAVRYLNSVIDNNIYPLEKIKKVSHSSRPIGLGMMGFAHALFKMDVKYDSLKAKEIAEDIMKFLTLVGTDESCIMAKENGKTFEWYNKEVYLKANERLFKTYSSFVSRFGNIVNKDLLADIKKYGVYNSSISSLAPTGSISTIVNTSSGIEPVFGLVYIRKVETGNKEYTEMFIADPVFEKFIIEKYPEHKDEIYAYVTKHNGSVQGCKYLTKEEKEVFVVASDITPEWHLEILEPFANYVSLSVSKTINMPKEATKEQVAKVYIDAFKKGVIGVTVYRDQSRSGILVHSNTDNDKIDITSRRDAPKRPQILPCDIVSTQYKGEKMGVLVSKYNGIVYEIFVAKLTEEQIKILRNHSTGFVKKVKTNHYNLLDDNENILIDNLGKHFGTSVEKTLARFISMTLRHQISLPFIVGQLNKSDDFMSFDKVVSRVIKTYIRDGESYKEACSECGGKMIFESGCVRCVQCYFSKCG